MANVTEQDIINHLKGKIRFHQNEAKRIEALLSAFTIPAGPVKSKKITAEAISESKAPLPETKKSKPVKAAKKQKDDKTPVGNTGSALAVPEEYKDSLTLNEKIAFALKEIGSGFNEDIARAMAQYQPQSDEKKISKQISGVLSSLKASGKIKAIRDGRKDKYTLA